MDTLTPDRTGDDLHRTCPVIAPGTHADLAHATAAGWKQRRVPGEESVGGERLVVVARRVQHHLDDAFDVAVRGHNAPDIHPEAARDGGAHLLSVQRLAFDLAALDHVVGQRLKDGLLLKREPQRLHLAEQATLLVTAGG